MRPSRKLLAKAFGTIHDGIYAVGLQISKAPLDDPTPHDLYKELNGEFLRIMRRIRAYYGVPYDANKIRDTRGEWTDD